MAGIAATVITLFVSLLGWPSTADVPGPSEAGPFLDGRLPGTPPPMPSGFEAVVAFTNLTFTNAMGLAAVPGSSRLAVWEREGRVWSFENHPATAEKTLLLDISGQCQGWGAAGLFSVAFHPEYAANGLAFVYYTWVQPGTVQGDALIEPPERSPGNYRDRLSRFVLDEGRVAGPEGELVLIDQVTDSLFHSGGSLFFHPRDGFLYWCNGDDYGGATQVIDDNLLSGVFRIDVDQRGGAVSHPIRRQPSRGTTAHYYIPSDNPFAGVENALEEFYALGLRNPYRMSCDPVSGRIFIGDVGEGSREEIDVIEPGDPGGLNFQWKPLEGAGGALLPPHLGASKAPLLDYPRSDGTCVVGGHVYRGTEFEGELGGKYIFGDNFSCRIWALDESTLPPSKVLLATMPRGEGPAPLDQYLGLSSFGTDQEGEIYFCQLSSSGGRIYKLAKAAPKPVVPGWPKLLSETGAFEDTAALRPAASLIAYDVNSPLWSDGAGKRRWFMIPAGTRIGFAASGEWRFPEGSVFVKHFELAAGTSEVRRLETRLLARAENGGVFGATYKWRADHSDADLLEQGLDELVEVPGARGGGQMWRYPSTSECLQCHTTASGGILGLNTRQLNREFSFVPGRSGNQLAAYSQAGLFDWSIPEHELSALPRLENVTNSAAPLELRARSYLDSNCSHCHRPGGSRAYWDGRFETPLVLSSILNGPVAQSFGVPGAKTIVPGEAVKSMIWHRAASVEPSVKMPPIARNIADTNALEVLRDFIESLPSQTHVLPGGWELADIGGPGEPGSASFAANSLKLRAGAGEIFYGADRFSFLYQPLEGNADISARIASISGLSRARAGIMVRETLEPGSRHAYAVLGNRWALGFFHRMAEGGGTDGPRITDITAPAYLRLTRSGDRFTGYRSGDGQEWHELGSVEIPFAGPVYAGFAFAGEGDVPAEFIIDKIETGELPPFNRPPAVTLQGPGVDEVYAAGPIMLTATAVDGDPEGSVPMVEFYLGSTRLGQATAAPFQLLVNAPAGKHDFWARAYDNEAAAAVSLRREIELRPLEITLERGVEQQARFSFSFPANPGIAYLTERSVDLIEWRPIATNTPSDAPLILERRFYGGGPEFFRVRPQ